MMNCFRSRRVCSCKSLAAFAPVTSAPQMSAQCHVASIRRSFPLQVTWNVLPVLFWIRSSKIGDCKGHRGCAELLQCAETKGSMWSTGKHSHVLQSKCNHQKLWGYNMLGCICFHYYDILEGSSWLMHVLNTLEKRVVSNCYRIHAVLNKRHKVGRIVMVHIREKTSPSQQPLRLAPELVHQSNVRWLYLMLSVADLEYVSQSDDTCACLTWP